MSRQHLINALMIGLLIWGWTSTAAGQDPSKADASVNAKQTVDIPADHSNPFVPVTPRTRDRGVESGRSQHPAPPTRPQEKTPDILLQSVDLQHLDASRAKDAFGCLLTRGVGKMVAQEQTNTLLIFDTADRLKKIVAELKKTDRPIYALTVESVTLQHIDAQTAANAIKPFASGAEAITVVKKSNSLILCDSKSKVDRMLAELKTLDVHGAGMVVKLIPLKNVDAQSVSTALKPLLSDGGVISVAKQNNALIVSDLEKNVDQIQAKVQALDVPTGTVAMRTFNLKFLKADSFKPVLDKMVSDLGSVGVNSASNSVIISDTSDNLNRIAQEIEKADRTPEQILVEVILMDVRLNNDTDIGINWDLLSNDLYHDFHNMTYRQNFTNRLTTTPSNVTTLGNGTAYNTTGTTTGGDFSIITGNVRQVIHLLQERKNVKIIASPRAMVVSGKTATIKAVEEIPYQRLTSSTQGNSAVASTDFKNVGVTLNVTATLTEENHIFLIVHTEQNVQTGYSNDNTPIVDTRSENTSLLLDDGQIVVMGGLRRYEKTKTVNQIPILSSIPIAGELFKSRSTSIVNSELVVLVSPHIYHDHQIPKKISKRIETFNHEFQLSKMSPEELAAMAGPVDVNQ